MSLQDLDHANLKISEIRQSCMREAQVRRQLAEAREQSRSEIQAEQKHGFSFLQSTLIAFSRLFTISQHWIGGLRKALDEKFDPFAVR